MATGENALVFCQGTAQARCRFARLEFALMLTVSACCREDRHQSDDMIRQRSLVPRQAEYLSPMIAMWRNYLRNK